MRKGVSGILVAIFLVIIAVGLSGAFIMFGRSTQETLTGDVEESVDREIESMQTSLAISDVSDGTVTVKNTGRTIIPTDGISILLGGREADAETDTGELAPGQSAAFSLSNFVPGVHTVRVSGPGGGTDEGEFGIAPEGAVSLWDFEDRDGSPDDVIGENPGYLNGDTRLLMHFDDDKSVFADEFSGNGLDPSMWDTFGSQHGSITVDDGELTISQTAGGGSNANLIGVHSKLRFPVGTVFKARVKNTAGRHSAIAAFGESPFCAFVHGSGCNSGVSLYSRADDPSARASLRRGDGTTNVKTPTVQDYRSYQTVEIRRVSSDLIEFYVDGERVGDFTSAGLGNDYHVYLSADGHTTPNTIVVDMVEVTPPDSYALDSTGYGNHGLFNNGPKLVAGVSRNALEFDGTDDYVDVGTHDYGKYTVTAWINTLCTSCQVVGGENDRHVIRIEGDGTLDEGTASNNPGTVVNDGVWHHVAAVYDGSGNAEMYVDGEADGENSKLLSGTVHLGHDVGFDSWYSGEIDEVSIHSRALSASEIEERFESRTATFSEYVPGFDDTAIGFSGDDHVFVNHVDEMQATGGISVEAFVRTDDADANHMIVDKRNAGVWDEGYALWLRDPPENAFEFGVQGLSSAVTGTVEIETDWHHVVGVYDAGDDMLRLYVDGELDNAVSVTGTPSVGTNPLIIGCRADLATSSCWDGRLDYAAVYDRALSADEISDIYDAAQ